MEKKFLLTGAFFGFLGVVAGAFGAHMLKKQLDAEMLQVFETAVKYQVYHSLAIILTGILIKIYGSKWLVWAAWLFISGIVVFSGSLYMLSLTGTKWLGAFTPFGGLAFLSGWICLMLQAWKIKN